MQRTPAIDTGIGVDYYMIHIYTGATGASILTIIADTGAIQLSGFENHSTYYRDILPFDGMGNTGTQSSLFSFTVSFLPPIVGTGYISAGMTGEN